MDTDSPRSDDSLIVYLARPGTVLASVPAMLGFVPQRSLVLAILRTLEGTDPGAVARIDAMVRFDLVDGRGEVLNAGLVADCVRDIDGPGEVVQILAVVVDDHPDLGPGPSWSGLASALADRFAEAGMPLGAAYILPRFTAGARWSDLLDPGNTGLLPDPASSAVAFGHVLTGQPIYGSRAEITALLGPDPGLADAVTREMDRARAAERDRRAAASGRGGLVEYLRGGIEFTLRLLTAMQAGSEPGAGELARLALVLSEPAARDVMFAVSAGTRAVAAERLWLLATRAVLGTDRAEAATLLGYSAYMRGDGPLAGIALDAALDALPAHPMAARLETSLRGGVRPAELRRLALRGEETATELGIDPAGLR